MGEEKKGFWSRLVSGLSKTCLLYTSRDRLEDIKTAQSLLEEDMESGKEKLQEQYIFAVF